MRSLQGRNTMTSQPIRDQVEDHLITPKNAALLIIDYQPPQVSSIVSMDHRTLVANIVATARLAKVFALPIVLSTVNVKTGGRAAPTHPRAAVTGGGAESTPRRPSPRGSAGSFNALHHARRHDLPPLPA